MVKLTSVVSIIRTFSCHSLHISMPNQQAKHHKFTLKSVLGNKMIEKKETPKSRKKTNNYLWNSLEKTTNLLAGLSIRFLILP